jgi:hypothetical protein
MEKLPLNIALFCIDLYFIPISAQHSQAAK